MALQLQSHHKNRFYFIRSFSSEHLYHIINGMKLRGLDIDDLFVLVMLDDGISVTEIGKRLYLTQPAISQRIAKIRRITEANPAMRINKTVKMTANGKIMAIGALDALTALLRSLPNPFSQTRSDALVHYIFAKASDRAAHKRDDA